MLPAEDVSCQITLGGKETMKYKNYIVYNGGQDVWGATFLPQGMVFTWNGSKYVAEGDGRRYEMTYEMITDPRMSEYVVEVDE